MYERKNGTAETEIVRKIYEWSKENLPRITWGKGYIDGSLVPTLDLVGPNYWPFGIYTNGYFEMKFQYMQMEPFNEESMRVEFINRLNDIPGVSIPQDKASRRPSFPVSVLGKDENLQQLFSVINWSIQEIKKYQP